MKHHRNNSLRWKNNRVVIIHQIEPRAVKTGGEQDRFQTQKVKAIFKLTK